MLAIDQREHVEEAQEADSLEGLFLRSEDREIAINKPNNHPQLGFRGRVSEVRILPGPLRPQEITGQALALLLRAGPVGSSLFILDHQPFTAEQARVIRAARTGTLMPGKGAIAEEREV